MEINGVYHFESKQNSFFDCDCWSLDERDCSARILCNEQYSKPQGLVEFIKRGARGKIDEDGLFIAVVYYKERLYIFADSTTSQWVMYYTVIEGKLFYSSSLKNLLKNSGIKREIDIASAKGFLQNGIVMGKHTLVANVYKLDVHEMLIVKNGSVTNRRIKYSTCKAEKDLDLISYLRKSIKAFADGEETVFMPLSAGFDSNMILSTLAKEDRTIDAFTIGGETGKNEISIVEKNIKLYKNITHHTALANRSLFQKLPEIIWRLDGYIYERGIFLQYLLADLVSKNGGKKLICGECSDEHQSLLYQNDMKRRQKENIPPLEIMDWMLQPYAWGNFVVIKKSALMLNSFGILGCYPFATKRFTDVAISLRKKNLDKKALYIALLKNELPRELYDGLFHAGGSTSIDAILTESDKTKMQEKISRSELIKRIKNESRPCYKSFWLDYSELCLSEKGNTNINVTIAYIKYRIKLLLNRLKLKSEQAVPLSNDLEADIKAYYLLLFEQLFLSGEYDSFFDSSIPQEVSL